MEKKERKTSEAKLRANAKYDAKTYKVIHCKCKKTDYTTFCKYAESQNIPSMNKLLYNCVMYCIDNNIQLK